MIALALDTATRTSAIAVLDGGNVVEESYREVRNHSKTLVAEVDELLKHQGLGPGDLQAVMAGIGPGSFTGLRIGLTVAKTLARFCSIPLVGISSLRALAENGLGLADHLCPVIDALKGEVYCARWSGPDAPLDQVEDEAARKPDSWAEELSGLGTSVAVFGSGVDRYRTVFEDILGDRAVFPASPAAHRISAAALGRLGLLKLEIGEADPPEELLPMYCRLSEAELALQRRRV